jgi:hypothetical protein
MRNQQRLMVAQIEAIAEEIDAGTDQFVAFFNGIDLENIITEL